MERFLIPSIGALSIPILSTGVADDFERYAIKESDEHARSRMSRKVIGGQVLPPPLVQADLLRGYT